MIDCSSIHEDKVNEKNEKKCQSNLLFLSPTAKSMIEH